MIRLGTSRQLVGGMTEIERAFDYIDALRETDPGVSALSEVALGMWAVGGKKQQPAASVGIGLDPGDFAPLPRSHWDTSPAPAAAPRSDTTLAAAASGIGDDLRAN